MKSKNKIGLVFIFLFVLMSIACDGVDNSDKKVIIKIEAPKDKQSETYKLKGHDE